MKKRKVKRIQTTKNNNVGIKKTMNEYEKMSEKAFLALIANIIGDFGCFRSTVLFRQAGYWLVWIGYISRYWQYSIAGPRHYKNVPMGLSPPSGCKSKYSLT